MIVQQGDALTTALWDQFLAQQLSVRQKLMIQEDNLNDYNFKNKGKHQKWRAL